MANYQNILIVCVDRDDDVGRKAGVKGPIVGREANIKAATKFAVRDPTDSDVNSIFGAVQAYDELKKKGEVCEVVTLTGHISRGFEADKRIGEQMSKVMEEFPADGFVLITDGADDDQIIPLLQNYAPLISKKMIIVKQAKGLESTYYTLIEALKDPFLSKVFFGIPGIILLLYFFLGNLGLQIVAFAIGLYLILKGFGIEDRLIKGLQKTFSVFSIRRTSFPFYLASIFIILFAFVNAYSFFVASGNTNLVSRGVESAEAAYAFLVLGGGFFIVGKITDAISLKKAYKLRKYILSAVGLILFWLILDSATRVVLGSSNVYWFLINVIISFVILLVSIKASEVFEVKNKITKLLIGLPVYNKEKRMIGRVKNIDAKKGTIEFRHGKQKKIVAINRRDFFFRKNRLIVSSA